MFDFNCLKKIKLIDKDNYQKIQELYYLLLNLKIILNGIRSYYPCIIFK